MSSLKQFNYIHNKLANIAARAPSEERASRLIATTEFVEVLSQIQNIVLRMVKFHGRRDHHRLKIRMVKFLGRNDHHRLQLDAARVLAKLVSGTSEHRGVANPLFVDELKFYWNDVTKKAVSALEAIAADYPECRNYVIETGALEPLLDILRDPNSELSMLRVATDTFLIFWEVRPPHKQLEIIKRFLHNLCERLKTEQDETAKKVACQIISKITAGSTDHIEAVIDAKIIPCLVSFLQHGIREIKKEAAEAIANSTIQASPKQIQYLVDQGCIQLLCSFCYSNDPSIVNACKVGLTKIIDTGEAIKYEGKNNGVNPYQQLLDVAHYTIRNKSNAI